MLKAWLLAALGCGVLLSLQAPLNSRLRVGLDSPLASALISFTVGMLVLLAIWLVRLSIGRETGIGSTSGFTDIPWWAWLGGFCGATYVTLAILALPHTGVLLLVACTVLGQQLGALLIDHFGWFGMARQVLSWQRVGGVLLVLAGTWLAQLK
ncbi:DMT family transporter [Herbaspirillum autotrophicum]|uniref:DMT family transporter n=1 Tax=Herbaspirillum autotrophicum TaxID=180195 RepID=UPI00067D06B5|nr:DMT family transporter [Herbaspirillum autotrophicum]